MISKSVSKRIKELNKEIDKLRSELNKESKKAFKTGVKELFDNYPTLESFGWAQYTPYFNDGEECIFGAYTDAIFLNGDSESVYAGELDSFLDQVNNKEKSIKRLLKEIEDSKNNKYEYTWRKEFNESRIKEIEEADPKDVKIKAAMVKDIVAFLSLIDNDTLRDMFGDHVMVTITKSGIETEQYEHD